MQNITREEAAEIEIELGLEPGDIASDRPMTLAERQYLSVPCNPWLALFVPFLGAYPALLIYEQDIETDFKQAPKHYLKGAAFATPEDALDDVKVTWAALVMARDQGQGSLLGEEVAMNFTSWSESSGIRWTWSVAPSESIQIFQGISRSLLTLPKLKLITPEYEGGRSPGMYIDRLEIDPIIFFHSVLFQGMKTFLNHNPIKLVRLSAKALAELKRRRDSYGGASG